MKINPLRNDYGVVIEPSSDSDRISDIDTEQIKDELKRSGVVLFRGFDIKIEDFEKFTLVFADKMVPNRETYVTSQNSNYRDRDDVSGDSLTATVNLHSGPIGWHSEDCHLPTSPHILFLYCEHPPLRGGATLLTDGIELFSQCEDKIRDFLTTHNHFHTWTLPVGLVAKLLGVVPENIEEAALGLSERLVDGQKLEVDIQHETIIVKFTEPLARIPRWSTKKAFCNRILLYRVLLETRLREGAAFSVVEPVPSDEFNEMLRVADSLAYLSAYHLHWQLYDLVMFDNTRIMHARAPILDDKRRILTRSCIANF
ncbi:TauD/TfdA family dioxygenase [Pseudomonas sp. ESBL9]|uniref:TauD/TfdA family dioxygenase n=1 Tax=Pseudomonas sp. ESBL9 TaxID=3077327 RepID=UPI002FC74230